MRIYTHGDRVQRDKDGSLHHLFADKPVRSAIQLTQVAKKCEKLFMSEQKILVTGGTGYIGSHACKALQRVRFTPVTFDSLVTTWKDAIKFGPF